MQNNVAHRTKADLPKNAFSREVECLQVVEAIQRGAKLARENAVVVPMRGEKSFPHGMKVKDGAVRRFVFVFLFWVFCGIVHDEISFC